MNDDFVIVEGVVATFNHLDTQGEILADSCTVGVDNNPVILTLDWNKDLDKILGCAEITKKPEGIWAKIHIRIPKNDQYRWEIVKHLRPCMGGYVVKKEQVDVLFRKPDESKIGSVKFLTEIRINEITLSMRNVDPHVISLDEMVKKNR